jgi:type I restriction enzyme, S subunit
MVSTCELPDGWRSQRLDQICRIRSGGTPPKSDAALWSGSFPWASGKDLKRHRLTDSIDHITPEAAELYSEVAPAGSVLALVRGMGLANSFAVSLIERPMAFNQDLKALIPSGDVVGPFLVHALMFASRRMLQNVTDAAHGTKRLSQDDLQAFEVPLPSLADQAAIASVLDRFLAAIDLEKAALKAAERLKRRAMHELFTHGLRGERRRELEFGEVPESWRTALLSDVAEVQTGAAKGRKFIDADLIDVPYLRVANVQEGHLDLSEMKTLRIRRAELDRYRLQDADVVLTEGGDFDKLGRGFIWRGELPVCIHQNHVFAVRTTRDVLLPEFFAYLAQSPYGRAYFLKVAHKTTNLACINSNKLKAFPILLPALDEQREIVTFLNVVDQAAVLHKQKRPVVEGVYKVLLNKLMTGDIRVSDLDLAAIDETTFVQVSA